MTIIVGDCRKVLKTLPDRSVQCCVTSPPYLGLRDYGVDGQIGLEPSVNAYVAELVAVFREVRRVLADDGVLWLNLGDCYVGGGRGGHSNGIAGSKPQGEGNSYPQSYRSRGAYNSDKNTNFAAKTRDSAENISTEILLKPKDLIGVPWRVAFALQADGWWLRNDIIWAKPNPMPESVRDRCTRSHEYVFHLSKSARYFYDAGATKEPYTATARASGKPYLLTGGGRPDGYIPTGLATQTRHESGRNKRTVWTITPKPLKAAHFAVMPPELVEPCIKAGSREGDTILDPFAGAGTVGLVAARLGRSFVGIELSQDYAEIARDRIASDAPLFSMVAD